MKVRLVFLCIVGLVAAMLPITAAIILAKYKSQEHQRERASDLASEILIRAQKVAGQILTSLSELDSAKSPVPCSEKNLNLMRKLVIQQNLLIDVGYVEDGKLVCSSFGSNGYTLGPPSYVGAGGYKIWTQFEHPLLPASHLLITADPHTGYAALVHEGSVLDGVPTDQQLIFGVMGVSRKKEIFFRGAFEPEWFKAIGAATDTSFFDGSRAVAWKRSGKYDFATYVAIPAHAIQSDWNRVLWILLPVCIAAALILAAVVAQVVRIQGGMPNRIRRALKRREFFLVFQPIVNMQTGLWVGAEALLRWRKPDGELVSPDVFIPVAEQSNLIEQITLRVIELMEVDAAELMRSHPDFHIALNLSDRDFCNPEMVTRLRSAAAKMGISTRCIHLEATERVFLQAEQTRKAVETLRAQGHSVAIDDFGTGYSSLSYLAHLKFDSLKIDKFFVGTIGKHAVTSSVTRHIIEMAKSLELAMIAEGIETEEQAQYLREHGVQFGQGWLFSKPINVAQLSETLKLQQGSQTAADEVPRNDT